MRPGPAPGVRRQGHRRRLDRHAEPLARPGRGLGLPGGQGRLRREAGQPQRRRGPEDGRGRPQVRPGRPDGHAEPQSSKGVARTRSSSSARAGSAKVYLAKGLCYKPRGVDRPQGRRAGARRASTTTSGSAPRPSGRSTPTGSTTSGTGTGTTATATSATRASTRWTSPAGAWARRPGRRRSSAPAAGSATRTTARRPTPRSRAYRCDDCELIFEVRGLPTNAEQGVKVGNIFYGTEGLPRDQRRQVADLPRPRPKTRARPQGRRRRRPLRQLHRGRPRPRPEEAPRRDPGRPPLQRPLPPRQHRLPDRPGLEIRPYVRDLPGRRAGHALLTREYRSPFTMPEKV